MAQDATGNGQKSFVKFSWRITALHTITYSLAGLVALITMHYKTQFSGEFLSGYMKPFNSPMIALGPFLQLINGFIMSVFLYPLASFLIDNINNSKKILFLLLAGFSFFTPQVPGIGNFEGIIYTKAPMFVHLIGIPECLIYSGLFAAGFSIWYRTEKKWINTLSIILIAVISLMSTLGYLDSIGLLPKK
jgi:hypothetical protein